MNVGTNYAKRPNNMLTGKSAAPHQSAIESVPKNYYKIISDNKDVTRGMMMLNSCVHSVKSYVAKALADLNYFSFLYLDDKDKFVEVPIIFYAFLRIFGHHWFLILKLFSIYLTIFH